MMEFLSTRASRVLFGVVAAAAASLTFAITTATAEEPSKFAPNAEHHVLGNGLEIVVIPDRRAPVVTHMLWYRVGAADEPPGQSGIAHFLEHLMFKGSTNFPDGQFSQIVTQLGGQENAFTAQDYTGYFQRTAKQHLRQLMVMEADRMRNLVLTDDVVTPERDVVLEERRTRIDNNPGGRLSEAVSAAFYKSHPYGIPIIGWEHEIRDLDREDALDFYNQFYGPENAVLVVAGDVETSEVVALAEETYGQIEPLGPPAGRNRPQEPPHEAQRSVVLRDERVRQPSVQIAFLVPSAYTAEDGVSEAIDVLSEILGGGPTSRIYRSMVIDEAIATSAGAWYQGSSIDATRFGLYASPRGDVSLEDLEDALNGALHDIIENGVTQEEVDRAVNSLMASAIYAQDSQQTLARIFGAGLASGATVEEIQTWPSRMAAVTPEQVQAAARQHLSTDAYTVGYLLPEEVTTEEAEEGNRS
ncbi:MAG: pitrilysin family protein [Pseudomonadota bacterium]